MPGIQPHLDPQFFQRFVILILICENNTVVSADTMYRHLQHYCSHPSICKQTRLILRLILITSQQIFMQEDNKLNFAKIMISVFDMVRKHCGKRRKCWLYFFHNVFKDLFFHRVAKSRNCLVKG